MITSIYTRLIRLQYCNLQAYNQHILMDKILLHYLHCIDGILWSNVTVTHDTGPVPTILRLP